MPQQFPEPFLRQSFSSLGFSQDFLAVSRSLHYYTPANLLQIPAVRIEKLPGFTQDLLFEFIRFLEARGLGDYLIDP